MRVQRVGQLLRVAVEGAEQERLGVGHAPPLALAVAWYQ